MKSNNDSLQRLRELILRAQSESLSDEEVGQLNRAIRTPEGAVEAASLLDQLAIFGDCHSSQWSAFAERLTENTCSFGEAPSGEAFSGMAFSGWPSLPATPVSGLGKSADRDWNDELTEPSQAKRSKPVGLVLALVASHLLIAGLTWSLSKPTPRDGLSGVAATGEGFGRNDATAALGNGNAFIPQLPIARPVAARSPQLVSMTACVWRSPGDGTPEIGDTLRSGEVLDLIEGVAELRVGDASEETNVRLEGPASVFIGSDGQLTVQRGSLTALSMGTGSQLVRFNTPIGAIAIRGQSSIGLTCGQSNYEFHLFDGHASIHPHGINASANPIELEKGDAVKIRMRSDDSFEVIRSAASKTNFVSVRSAGFDPLDLDESYASAILSSEPKVYWRFEESVGKAPYYIKNLGSEPNMNAVILGEPSWRQYGKNRVADLGHTPDLTAFQSLQAWPPEPLDDYTIECWVKPQLYHHGEIICLHSTEPLDDGRYPHTMMLESIAHHFHSSSILKGLLPNRFRLVHRSLGSSAPINMTDILSKSAYHARVWQHVVSQSKGERKMLWVDGKLSAELINPAPLSANVKILVGQVYPDSSYRKFIGQIDEVAIYDRCLAPNEIRAHIKAAGRTIPSGGGL